jgi:hypothetical protein
MNARLIFVMVLLFISSAHFVHSETPTAVTGLIATMALDKGDGGEYASDHPIKLTYTIKNESTANVYVLRWGTPLEGFMSNMLEVTPAGGVPIDYDGLFVSRVGPLPEDYVEIPAGKSLSVELPVHEKYKIQTEGKYTVTLRQKMVLDAVHKKPAPGELAKRNFVPAAVQMTKKDQNFIQKEPRPLKPVRTSSKLHAPVIILPPQRPVTPVSPAPGIIPPPQQPATPGAPAPINIPPLQQPGIPPGVPTAPHNLRQINEAPYPLQNYGRASGTIRYADFVPPTDIIRRHKDWDVEDRVEIADPDKQVKVMDAYRQAYKIAAESKVIVNAGETAASKAKRFTSWFGPFSPNAADKPVSCNAWITKFGADNVNFGDRFTSVRLTFGGIYNRFFDKAPDGLVRFFQGPKSAKGESQEQKDYTEAIKADWPCDYRSVVAYVYGWESRPVIFLCDSFFDPPQGYKIDQAGVIIHELSHKANKAFQVEDWAYEDDECSKIALCVPDEAPKNADNYHLFASNPSGLGLGLEPGQWYAHFRTADGYYLSKSAGGTLNSTNKDSTLCSNCTFILEALETTGTATTLKTGQTVRLLTIDRQNALSATGGIVQTDSTSQKDFWIKKKGSGASAAGGEITTGDEIYFDPVTGGARLNVTTGAGNKNDLFIIELAR